MSHRILPVLIVLALATACGGEGTASGASAVTDGETPAPAGGVASTLHGIVLRYAPGGRPDRFCQPQWSFANQTDVDIPGLLISIEWQTATGEVLQAAGEFGTLQENLSAGRVADRTLMGHPIACDQLRIVVGSYACRDANAVRTPCPGPVHVLTEGGIQAELSALREGRMRGAVEP